MRNRKDKQRNVANKLRRALNFIASCPQCWPHLVAFGLMFLCLAFVAWAFGVTRSDSLTDHILTTTITATTESFRFVTPATRESAWSLPPGRFSILGIADNEHCTVRGFESLCHYDANTRLEIKGAANIDIQKTPNGGWTLSVAEVESTNTTSAPATNITPIDARLLDASGKTLLQSDQLLEFQTGIAATAIRMPIVANAAVLGADLHQSSTIDGSAYDFWQPVLLTGDILMIANNKPFREKYQVHGERLDPGDVVHIGDETSVSAIDDGNSVWGMLTIGAGAAPFQVVLHTSLRQVSVTRFGAPGGHEVKAPFWSILQKWPNGQSVWVAFVSLILILGFVLQLGATFAGRSQGASTESPLPLPGLQDVDTQKTGVPETEASKTETQAPIVDGLPKLSNHDEPDERGQEEKKNVEHQISPTPH